MSHISDKGLASRIYKEILWCKTNKKFLNRVRIRIDISRKKIQHKGPRAVPLNLGVSIYVHSPIYNFQNFLKLYFINYAITVVLIFPPLHPSTQQPPHPQAIPPPLFMSMGHVYKCISSLTAPFPILYVTSPWLFCNYLFVLLYPLTSSPIPLGLPPIWQP